MHVFFRLPFLTAIFGLLAGCAGESRLFQQSIAAIWQADKFNDLTLAQSLYPTYGYLRVQSGRGAILMVWGYVDVDHNSNQPIDVWYSGSREAIKLQEGRIVATAGLASDWLAARYQNAPSWTYLLKNPAQTTSVYQRSLDLKINYQFNQTQTVTLTRIPKPAAHTLKGQDRSDVVWFEEKAQPSQLPASVYAVVPNWNQSGQAKVVYTWHCFKVDDCFSLQAWTPQDQTAAVAANAVKATQP